MLLELWYHFLCMKLVIFYSIITFSYTKYFIHSYTVDVVFTLSYYLIQWYLFGPMTMDGDKKYFCTGHSLI